MGIWTTSSNQKFEVNIDNKLIEVLKKEGAHFCWMKDTPGINDDKNETFYQEKTDDDETHRVLREGITVKAENGKSLTGYIVHWVENKNGLTSATNIKNWFIFQPAVPGTPPIEYIISQ